MRTWILTICLVAFAAPASADFEEQRYRDSAQSNSHVDMFMHNYKDLNKFAERYRTPNEHTPSGAPTLEYYYAGIVQYAKGLAVTPDGAPIDSKWESVIADMKDWIGKAPSPSAYVALAKLYVEWGWLHRGDSVAANVDPEQWKPFREKLLAAHQVLLTYKAQASVDPEWYRTMLTVSRGEEWDQGDRSALYKEALAKFPYYPGIYYGIAQILQPKWGGSWAEFDSFARFATKNSEKMYGSSMYAMIYRREEASCGCSILDESNVRWSALKADFTDLVSRYPTQWNISSFAYFSCMARDKPTTKALMVKMREYSAETWDNRNDYHDKCVRWALGSGNAKAPDNE